MVTGPTTAGPFEDCKKARPGMATAMCQVLFHAVPTTGSRYVDDDRVTVSNTGGSLAERAPRSTRVVKTNPYGTRYHIELYGKLRKLKVRSRDTGKKDR